MRSPRWGYLAKVPEYAGWVCVSLFLLPLSRGRFTPRWTRAVAVLVAVLQIPLTFLPESSLSQEVWWDLLLQILFLGIWGSGLLAQLYRFRHVSDTVQRQQTKWVVFGVAAAITGLTGAVLPGLVSPSLASAGSPYTLTVAAVGAVPLLFIPLTIGVAILRHHLWNINVVINRTLVYGALTASVAGLYIVVVGYLGAVLRTGGNLLVSLVAASLVAVLFQPLRERLQRGVNRLMVGERDVLCGPLPPRGAVESHERPRGRAAGHCRNGHSGVEAAPRGDLPEEGGWHLSRPSRSAGVLEESR